MLVFPLLQKDLGAWSPWGKFLQLTDQMDIIYAEVKKPQENRDPSGTDMLSLMMAAKDEQGQQMSDVELRDELITLLVVGHKTTATSLTWALYCIHHFPQMREQLFQELDNLREKPDANQIFKSPYLNALCSETLRLYPVAMLALNKLVKSPLEVMGYNLEPGTLVICCIYLTHHREDLYPDSKQFKPERFLERQFSTSEFLSFGCGNRRCIGMAFALFKMKLVLPTILSQWEMELADTELVQPARKGALLGPSGGVKMVVNGKRFQSQRVFDSSMI
jgi:unspecific monooxygenase